MQRPRRGGRTRGRTDGGAVAGPLARSRPPTGSLAVAAAVDELRFGRLTLRRSCVSGERGGDGRRTRTRDGGDGETRSQSSSSSFSGKPPAGTLPAGVRERESRLWKDLSVDRHRRGPAPVAIELPSFHFVYFDPPRHSPEATSQQSYHRVPGTGSGGNPTIIQ